jgi:hypothetical protein
VDFGWERSSTMKSLVHRASGWWFLTGAVAWGSALAGGFLAIHAYEATPGSSGLTVLNWPGGGRLALAGDRPTLVMAAHPRCPCTRASAAELVRILARCDGRVMVYVLIFVPRHAEATWAGADGSASWATIPGVHAIDDRDGVEAARFGARTSGQVALYAPDGRLLFRGGITGARGQQGTNCGREAVISLLLGRPDRHPGTPVFGCPIF